MKIVEIWIEHPIQKLNQKYSYFSYAENITQGTRVSVDFGKQELIGFVADVYDTDESIELASQRIGFELKEIKSILDEKSLITPELQLLASYMEQITLAPMIACFQAMLPSKIKPLSNRKAVVMEEWAVIGNQFISLTPKQLLLYQFIAKNQPVKCSKLRKESPFLFRKLVALGAISIIHKPKEAIEDKIEVKEKKFILNDEQQAVINEITESDDHIFLLHGVTGSGKTEIYLQLAQKVLDEGKQVLFLVPEISLTPQMIDRISKRFGSGLAIYHSSLSSQEKYEQYQKVITKQARIVVGTRSAVFLPFCNLGLIVMDEEHDSSYKQDVQPSYHCRDIAIWRANHHQCNLIMGSATPSLESYARAMKKVYHLLEMKHRVNQQMPNIQLVSLKPVMYRGESYIISNLLKEKIYDRLKNRKQIILLLNRRGYHTQLRCKSCQEVLCCPHCDLAMSYHRVEKAMKCHNCGTTIRIPQICPSCRNSKGFLNYGFGTQRLEEEVKRLFPQARILRMDRDTTTKKNSHRNILESFAKHDAEILIGTQMIAKGLDYPDVTLVGIINGDEGLARNDYRSCEMTYHLLTQASGRSGRSKEAGEVVIQVFDPEHYVVQCAVHHDYKRFFQQEMKFRHMGQYPPYTYMLSIVVMNHDYNRCQKNALWLKQQLIGDFKIIGVAELLKLRDQYRMRILLKGKKMDEMLMAVRELLQKEECQKMKDIRIDVNPLMLD